MRKTLTRITKTPTQAVSRDWFVMDAKGEILGRLATKAAEILMGKGKPTFTAGKDMGDNVVIVNAKDVAVTGRKEEKAYYRHSGYPGGLKTRTLSQLREEDPERIIRNAVRGMLPKNRLGDEMIRKLHISASSEHSYTGKNLVEVKLG